MFAIDHLALPCFDVRATLRFYTGLLGGAVRHAQSGPAEEWKAKEYLLVVIELPGGAVVDFFSFDGIRRPPPDGLPKDIRHVALSLATRADVVAYKARFEAASVPFWTETHGADDLHVYVTDPNGVVLELVAKEDSVRARPADPRAAAQVLDAWLIRH
jgi:catechol 2,3-dioxygenase-like lactoylglutathione lyase family enzyme